MINNNVSTAIRSFQRFDTNRDGQLNNQELQNVARSVSFATGRRVSVDEVKARLDGDGNGSVSINETIRNNSAQGQANVAQLAHFDTNNDGQLNPRELQGISQVLYQQTGVFISPQQIQQRLDRNGDGNVGFAEVREQQSRGNRGAAQTNRRFDRTDRNNDGAISGWSELSHLANQETRRSGKRHSIGDVLRKHDHNNDGRISNQELQQTRIESQDGYNRDAFTPASSIGVAISAQLQSMGSLMNADQVKATFDTNKDGMISKAELKDAKQRFRAAMLRRR